MVDGEGHSAATRCMSLRFGIAAIAMFFVAMSQRPRGVASTDAQNEGPAIRGPPGERGQLKHVEGMLAL